nr:FecR domain-containing protein [Candidatus Aminicenantes bacterium]
MRKMAGILIAILFFFSTLGAEETQYTNYTFARLSYMTGKAYIQRAADLGYEEAVLNTAISEGDRIGTTDGRAEIYLGKANYVRLDKDTKIDFLNLPKKGYDLVRIRIWSGNVYINVGSLEEEKDIEIHTSDVSVYVLEEGLYRIDVRQNRETEIFVFEGIVEAAGETGSVLIKDEQRLEASNARFTSRPTPFRAIAEDSFDRWSEHRDSKIRKHLAKAYLPEELEDFEHELAEY